MMFKRSFASKLRQRLVQEKGAEDFRRYDQLLWPYEFRSRPVNDTPAVRTASCWKI